MEERTEAGFNHSAGQEELDIRELMYLLVRKWWFILLFAAVFAAAGFSFTSVTYEPVFVADASMVVNSKQLKVVGGEVTLTNDIYLSQKMVNTYQVILLSDTVLNLVNEEIGRNLDLETMRRWITVSSPRTRR